MLTGTARIEYCQRGKRDAVRHARLQNRNAVHCRLVGHDDAANLARYRRDLWIDDARRYARLIAKTEAN